MAAVSDVELFVEPVDARAGRVTPVLTVTANLGFDQTEVARREKFEVEIEIWAFDWEGDPAEEDRPQDVGWPALLLLRPRPILKFTWPGLQFPVGTGRQEYKVIAATSEEMRFRSEYTVPHAIPNPLNEDPGFTIDTSNTDAPISWNEDEVYAVVRIRSARRASASSEPVSVQTGRPIA